MKTRNFTTSEGENALKALTTPSYRCDAAQMALEEMRSYWVAHPSSPAAVRLPVLSIRRGLWMALLGPSVEEGIIGIGSTVEAALRAFDTQYLAALRPPVSATAICQRIVKKRTRRIDSSMIQARRIQNSGCGIFRKLHKH